MRANEVMEECPLWRTLFAGRLIVRRHAALSRHVLGRRRILHDAGIEVGLRERIHDDVAFGPYRTQTARRVVVALDAEHVAGATHVPEPGLLAGLVPQRDRT